MEVDNNIQQLFSELSKENRFKYFLDRVKANDYLTVKYILSNYFQDKEERAKFANPQDEQGNTAFHYIAQLGYVRLVSYFNDIKEFPRRISFVKINLEGKKPLDLCCELGDFDTFHEIWKRAGKVNHNPMHALSTACKSGNIKIIEAFLQHPKFKTDTEFVPDIIEEAREGSYNESVKELIYKYMNFSPIKLFSM